jgi:hypothetical protein
MRRGIKGQRGEGGPREFGTLERTVCIDFLVPAENQSRDSYESHFLR